MQRLVLLASVVAAQCPTEPATPTNVASTKACQAFDSTLPATALAAGNIPNTKICAPVCSDTAAKVPKAATNALYTCNGTTAVANWDCVEGCPAQGPVTPADLARTAMQGYCGSDANATNWVVKDGSCTNQCTKTDSVAWPKTTACAAGGKLEKYNCVDKTACIIINKSTEAAARHTKNCGADASETFDSANKGSIIAKDKKCVYTCPDKYKVKGTKTEITCDTDHDYSDSQNTVWEFECEKDDAAGASSVSLAVSVLAVMKAAFA